MGDEMKIREYMALNLGKASVWLACGAFEMCLGYSKNYEFFSYASNGSGLQGPYLIGFLDEPIEKLLDGKMQDQYRVEEELVI